MPALGLLVLAQLGIGDGQPELRDLRHVAVEELLPRLVVALALDPPDVHRILVGWNRVPVELHQRAPPAVERLLDELALRVGAVHHRQDHVAAVENVERLLPADLLHDPRVGRVRALEERLLADDRGRVDEPGDHADVAPGLRRVVEDVVELRLARDQVVEALLARLAEVLDHAVDQLRVADLVLNLRRQREFPLQGGRAQDPLALWEDAHQLRVAVHLDELAQARAVLVGHPVVGLDLAAGLHVLEEFVFARHTERSLGYHRVNEAKRADAAGCAALRRKGVPRHVDRRDRRGAGRPEGLDLRPHPVEAGPALRDDARGRARLPRRARRDPGRALRDREDPARAPIAPARRRRSARGGDGVRAGVAVPRGRAARRDPRRAPTLRGAHPRTLPRGPRARRPAHRSRRRDGRAAGALGLELGLYLAPTGSRHRRAGRPLLCAADGRHARLRDTRLTSQSGLSRHREGYEELEP